MVRDFRGLNKKLLIERFGIPLIKDILAALSGKVVFSELDLRHAAGLPPVRRGGGRPDQAHFQIRWKVLSLGAGNIWFIANLSDHCQRIISSLFTDIAEVKVYLDNIITAMHGIRSIEGWGLNGSRSAFSCCD